MPAAYGNSPGTFSCKFHFNRSPHATFAHVAMAHFGLDIARREFRPDLEASYELDLANDRPQEH